jgi:hypothetical protein
MSDVLTRLLDRLLALAPLGVLAYLIGRQANERHELLEALERNSAAARDRERELLNRITHPHLMPTGTRRDADTRPRVEVEAAIAAKRAEQAAASAQVAPELVDQAGAWGGLGTAARPFPWPITDGRS